MDEGQGRYTMGGYAGPSERIPADIGVVNMRPPGALPFNPAPHGNVHQGVAATARPRAANSPGTDSSWQLR